MKPITVNRRLQGLAIDLNGVMIDWRPAPEHSAVAQRLGEPEANYLQACQEYDAAPAHPFEVGLSCGERMRGILVKLGRNDLLDKVDDLVDLELDELIARSYLLPGVLETLEKLRADGRRLVICSNASPYGVSVAREHGLIDAVDGVTFSCHVHVRKPEPGIYERSVALLGQHPENCALVDDGNDDALAGAKRFNRAMTTIRVDHPAQPPESKTGLNCGDHRIPGLNMLPELLEFLSE